MGWVPVGRAGARQPSAVLTPLLLPPPPPQAGAAHVYGVDMSRIADSARQIVADNGFADT